MQRLSNVIRIGTAGWSIPRTASELVAGAGSHLERYGRQFLCAEVNTSFYRAPRTATWQRWAASVPAGFQFAVKAPKAITHEGKLAAGPAPLTEFLGGARLLGERLGPLLFQLPPKLAFDNGVATAFFAMLREAHDGPVALEPRHASWFSAEVSELLAGFRIARVAANPARVPEAAGPGGWTGLRYYRLHGSPRVYYSRYEPEYLAGLAHELAEASEADAWVIFDNTASGAALHNALELSELLAGDRAGGGG